MKYTGLIILDGPDACGKTTLQNWLVDGYDGIGIHLTYPAPDNLTMWEYQTREMVKAISLSQDNLVVVDRHWVSEKIYANVFRGGSPWPHMGRMIHRVWMKHSAVNVLCLPSSIEGSVKRHNDNLDDRHPYPDDKFIELLQAYSTFALTVKNNPFFMEYRIEEEGQNIDFFMEQVTDRMVFLQARQYHPAKNIHDQNILGHLHTAKALIVGEQSNPKKFHQDYKCFYPFYEYGNSSLYLTEILADLGAVEERLMWTNAMQMAFISSPHVAPLVRKGINRIIALGKRAESIVYALGINRDKIHCIPHPQFAKRFGVEGYDQMIKEALGDEAFTRP